MTCSVTRCTIVEVAPLPTGAALTFFTWLAIIIAPARILMPTIPRSLTSRGSCRGLVPASAGLSSPLHFRTFRTPFAMSVWMKKCWVSMCFIRLPAPRRVGWGQG